MRLLFPTREGVSSRRTLRNASSRASFGIAGFSRPIASRNRAARTTSPKEARSAAASSGARCSACSTPYPSSASQLNAASSTTDSLSRIGKSQQRRRADDAVSNGLGELFDHTALQQFLEPRFRLRLRNCEQFRNFSFIERLG